MVLTILATYALLATEHGFRLTSGQLNERVPGLSIEQVKGNLIDGITSPAISYENEQFTLKANGIQSQWSSEFFGRKFTIKQAVIEEIDIELLATKAAEPAAERESITLPNITLPLAFDAELVLIKSLRIKPAAENAPVQLVENIRLSLNAEREAITINHLQANYKNITLTANGDIELEGEYPLALDITTEVADVIDGKSLKARTTLDNSLEKLFIRSSIKSPVQASLNGVVQPLDKKLPAQLRLVIDNAGWPIDTNELALLTATDFAISGDMDDYEFSLDTTIEGKDIPKSTVLLKGFANPGQVLLPVMEISTLDGDIRGKAGLQIAEHMNWVATIGLSDINPGLKFPELQGKLFGNIEGSGQIVENLWSLELTQGNVNGELRGFPFKIKSRLNKSLDNTLNIDFFKLDNNKNQLAASGSVSQQWDLAIDANLPELQNFLPELAGGFKTNANITGELETPNITLDANAAVIKLNDLLLRGLTINADVKSAGNDQSTVTIKADKLNQGTNELSNIALKLDGTRAAHTLSTFVDGPTKTSVDLLAQGSLSENFDWAGAMSRAKLELPGHNLTLREPLEINWNQALTQFSASPHCWDSVDASLCLKNKVVSTGSSKAEVAITNYELEQLNLFLPASSQLKGVVTANTIASWGDDVPGGYAATLDANIENGTVKVTDPNGRRAEFKYKTFDLTGDASANNVDAELTIDSSTLGAANIVFNLDPTTEDQAISGRIDLDGLSIGLVKAFLPEFQTVEGVIKADGDLSGSLSDPKFDGNVYLNNLQLAAADILPLPITAGDITTRVKGSRAFIFGELKSNEGVIDVEGNANWRELEAWQASVNISGENLSVVQNPITESSVNPNIAISVRPGRLDITGDVSVPSARINIKDLPRGATTLSPDIVIVEDQQKVDKRTEELEQNNLVAVINVDVELGDDVKLSGYGLDASLAGDMNIQIKTPKPVQLGGELRIVRGVYKSYGQDLLIEDGQILFVGPVDQTSLDMDAIRIIEGADDGNDLKAGLHLEGKIADPKVTLFTDPAGKSQESTLSYIVLGRDIAETSDQESNLLASAVLALTLKGGRNVGQSIASGLGIKEFELDARGKDNDTEVIVSGRVNDRLLLRYGRNVFEAQSTLYLRYDITKKLYLEAARGIERAVDLFYSFSF